MCGIAGFWTPDRPDAPADVVLGAMTGAIAGARNGPSALPGALLAALTDRGRWGAEALAGLALRCAAVARRPLDTVEPGVIVAESTRS